MSANLSFLKTNSVNVRLLFIFYPTSTPFQPVFFSSVLMPLSLPLLYSFPPLWTHFLCMSVLKQRFLLIKVWEQMHIKLSQFELFSLGEYFLCCVLLYGFTKAPFSFFSLYLTDTYSVLCLVT